MGLLSDKLIDSTYVPDLESSVGISPLSKTKPCPVRFTTDPIEFAESQEFLGMRLRPLQKAFLLDLYALDENNYPKYDSGVFIAGMRGGKSALASVVAGFQVHQLLSFENPAKHFNQMSGQRLTIQFIASSEAQAKETAYAAFEGIIESSYWFTEYIKWLGEREEIEGLGKNSLYEKLSNRIEFKEKNVAILSLHSNSSALAGKTSACCIFDELSRLDVADSAVQSKSQKRTAQAVYNTVARAATSLLPFSKVITITSPMYEDDYGMRLLYMAGTFKGGSQSHTIASLRKRYQGRVERLLGYHFTTFELNPKFDEEGNALPGGFDENDAYFKSSRLQDPEAFRRDYLAIPPSAISPFFEYPERIDVCLYKNVEPKVIFSTEEFSESVDIDYQKVTRTYVGKSVVIVRPDKLIYDYYISCDQGESKDSFVVAMAHAEEVPYDTNNAQGTTVQLSRFKVKVDFIELWVPDKERRITVSFPNVDDCIETLAENYHIKKVVYDHWNSVESIQRLFSKGILTEKSKSSDNTRKYELFKTLVYDGLVELPENDQLVKELRQLNKIRGKVDHPGGDDGSGRSDAADAIVRCVWEVYTEVIMSAMQGSSMRPLAYNVPTLRSISSAYDIMNNTQQQSLWNTGFSGSKVFGKGIHVKRNVFPNLPK